MTTNEKRMSPEELIERVVNPDLGQTVAWFTPTGVVYAKPTKGLTGAVKCLRCLAEIEWAEYDSTDGYCLACATADESFPWATTP